MGPKRGSGWVGVTRTTTVVDALDVAVTVDVNVEVTIGNVLLVVYNSKQNSMFIKMIKWQWQ